MKGWILLENNKPVIHSNNSVKVFRTQIDLFNFYNGTLGDLNSIKKVNIIITKQWEQDNG